jgi:hypothetical protein
MSCGVAVFEGIRNCIEKKVKLAEEQKMRVCLTIFTFDDKIERLDIPTDPTKLKTEHYEIIKWGVEPRGWTRLYDTIHQAAMYTTTLQDETDHQNSRGFMVIITDGEDNLSDISHANLKKEIESHQKTGMEYIFIGANIDAQHTGSSLGISPAACMQFSPDPTLTQTVFDSLGMAIERSVNNDDEDFEFSQMERQTSCNPSDRKRFNIDAVGPSHRIERSVNNYDIPDVPGIDNIGERDIFVGGVDNLFNVDFLGSGGGGGCTKDDGDIFDYGVFDVDFLGSGGGGGGGTKDDGDIFDSGVFNVDFLGSGGGGGGGTKDDGDIFDYGVFDVDSLGSGGGGGGTKECDDIFANGVDNLLNLGGGGGGGGTKE